MRAPLSVVALVLVAGTALVCGWTLAYAEPLFFDCHGTIERYPHYEKLEDHQKPQDTREQLMIDPDGGIVEGPGAVWPAATNEFCSKESDWRTRATQPGIMLLFKDIRVCNPECFGNRLYIQLDDGSPLANRPGWAAC